MRGRGNERIFSTRDKRVFQACGIVLLVGALAVAVSQIRPADDWIHILGTLSIAVGFVAAFGILPTLMTRDLVRTADGALRLGADQCGSLVRAYGHDAYGQTELVGDS